MEMEELWDDYFQYLLWRCGLEKERKWMCILSILHNINFDYLLERDDNRYDDGVSLRDQYAIPDEYLDYEDEFMDQPCSVLEMLIGLAIRVDDEIIGDPAEARPQDFFLEMVENLALGEVIKRRYKDDEVFEIVDRWMSREFEPDGSGSPFPVKYDIRDQRKLEIWDQVNSYINENY